MFLLFALLKVLGFITLTLLYARALHLQNTAGSNLRTADMTLGVTLMGSVFLALYVLMGMRVIQSEAFAAHWGTGTSQGIAGAIMVALFLLFGMPLYNRQYYDLAVVIGLKAEELNSIKGSFKENSLFVKIFTKRFSLVFLPLFTAHVFIAKFALGKQVPMVTSAADAVVTCAMALVSGYAIASTFREMADRRITQIH